MFKPHYGHCTICQDDNQRLLVVGHPPMCDRCNRMKKARAVLEKGLTGHKKAKVRKVTGELALFKSIWDTTEHHRCWVCDEGVPVFGVIHFSHILTKGAYPAFRLNPANIKVKCAACHHAWDFGHTSGPEWDKVKKLKEELKYRYYNP